MRYFALVVLLLLSALVRSEDVTYTLYSKPDCGACIALKKVLVEMKIEVKEGVADSETQIYTYPTLIIRQKGSVRRISGVTTKEALQAAMGVSLTSETVPFCKTN